MINKHSAAFRGMLTIFLLLALCISCSDGNRQPKIEKPSADIAAPDFNLKDLKGKSIKLSDFRGHPVLLIFSATWCPNCRSETTYYKELYAAYHSRGLEIITIDIQEPEDVVERFMERYQLPYKILLDKTGQVAEAYAIRGVPSLVLIDQEGKLLCHQCRSVESILEIILSKK